LVKLSHTLMPTLSLSKLERIAQSDWSSDLKSTNMSDLK